ncbi:hypothetical protein BHE74_00020327 [Ensete ventricosum]|nr:hypothetical protein GW17_00051112 [Ensete ventricosum]RWW71901.1 hypothetical protein BHE74_00020327 [Ensete ventricosum]RZS21765.1 hypothetical protein BHM03_00054447 [Ensete ventricosum]
MIKVRGLLKQQPITVLINIGSTNNFMNSKVAARMAVHIEDCSRFDVKVILREMREQRNDSFNAANRESLAQSEQRLPNATPAATYEGADKN